MTDLSRLASRLEVGVVIYLVLEVNKTAHVEKVIDILTFTVFFPPVFPLLNF